MRIIEIKAADQGVLDGINGLLPQLSPNARAISKGHLERVIDTPHGALIAAVENKEVLGCLVLNLFPVLTDIRAWVDDLVVGMDHRGRGIGGQLLRHAITLARSRGARSINLTCHPMRREANALYRSIGFQQRETNAYHYGLGSVDQK